MRQALRLGLEVYYMSVAGYRGAPVTTLTWSAWDGVMVRSVPASVVIAVKCPVGQCRLTLSNSR
jgi:hypothetical protein